jgi:hypothetical protein
VPRGVRAPGFSFSSLASFQMTLLLIGFSLGMLNCWLMNRVPRDRDLDWRRSFNHENTNRPSEPPPLKLRRSERFTEGGVQRGNGNGGPSSSKPVIQPQVAGASPRPPGGLRPRFIADEARLREVADAINRYTEAGRRAPVEWLDEYDELGRKVEASRMFNVPALRAGDREVQP